MNSFDEISNVLQKNNNFLITSHINLDGDAIGSELALYSILKKLKKKPIILNQGKLPKIYDFLPGVNKVQYLEDDYIDTKNIDVGIALDCSNVKRMGKTYEIFKNIKTTINIDHHASNESFGDLNYVDSSVSSVGEIIYELIRFINVDLLDKDISTYLFTSILTDTGSFRYSNVSSRTFKIASDLTSFEINPHLIAAKIYNRNTYPGLKLLGEALSTLDNNEISILFKETKDNKIKISFRSKGNFDVNKFAGKFNGGGHPNAAGCLCSGKMYKIKDKILSQLFKEIKSCEAE